MKKKISQIKALNLHQRKSFQTIILHRVLALFRKQSQEVTLQFNKEHLKLM